MSTLISHRNFAVPGINALSSWSSQAYHPKNMTQQPADNDDGLPPLPPRVVALKNSEKRRRSTSENRRRSTMSEERQRMEITEEKRRSETPEKGRHSEASEEGRSSNTSDGRPRSETSEETPRPEAPEDRRGITTPDRQRPEASEKNRRSGTFEERQRIVGSREKRRFRISEDGRLSETSTENLPSENSKVGLRSGISEEIMRSGTSGERRLTWTYKTHRSVTSEEKQLPEKSEEKQRPRRSEACGEGRSSETSEGGQSSETSEGRSSETSGERQHPVDGDPSVCLRNVPGRDFNERPVDVTSIGEGWLVDDPPTVADDSTATLPQSDHSDETNCCPPPDVSPPHLPLIGSTVERAHQDPDNSETDPISGGNHGPPTSCHISVTRVTFKPAEMDEGRNGRLEILAALLWSEIQKHYVEKENHGREMEEALSKYYARHEQAMQAKRTLRHIEEQNKKMDHEIYNLKIQCNNHVVSNDILLAEKKELLSNFERLKTKVTQEKRADDEKYRELQRQYESYILNLSDPCSVSKLSNSPESFDDSVKDTTENTPVSSTVPTSKDVEEETSKLTTPPFIQEVKHSPESFNSGVITVNTHIPPSVLNTITPGHMRTKREKHSCMSSPELSILPPDHQKAETFQDSADTNIAREKTSVPPTVLKTPNLEHTSMKDKNDPENLSSELLITHVSQGCERSRESFDTKSTPESPSFPPVVLKTTNLEENNSKNSSSRSPESFDDTFTTGNTSVKPVNETTSMNEKIDSENCPPKSLILQAGRLVKPSQETTLLPHSVQQSPNVEPMPRREGHNLEIFSSELPIPSIGQEVQNSLNSNATSENMVGSATVSKTTKVGHTSMDVESDPQNSSSKSPIPPVRQVVKHNHESSDRNITSEDTKQENNPRNSSSVPTHRVDQTVTAWNTSIPALISNSKAEHVSTEEENDSQDCSSKSPIPSVTEMFKHLPESFDGNVTSEKTPTRPAVAESRDVEHTSMKQENNPRNCSSVPTRDAGQKVKHSPKFLNDNVSVRNTSIAPPISNSTTSISPPISNSSTSIPPPISNSTTSLPPPISNSTKAGHVSTEAENDSQNCSSQLPIPHVNQTVKLSPESADSNVTNENTPSTSYVSMSMNVEHTSVQGENNSNGCSTKLSTPTVGRGLDSPVLTPKASSSSPVPPAKAPASLVLDPRCTDMEGNIGNREVKDEPKKAAGSNMLPKHCMKRNERLKVKKPRKTTRRNKEATKVADVEEDGDEYTNKYKVNLSKC